MNVEEVKCISYPIFNKDILHIIDEHGLWKIFNYLIENNNSNYAPYHGLRQKKDFIMSWCPNCKDLVDTYKEWYQDEEGDIITEYFCEKCGYSISHYEDKLKRNGK